LVFAFSSLLFFSCHQFGDENFDYGSFYYFSEESPKEKLELLLGTALLFPWPDAYDMEGQ